MLIERTKKILAVLLQENQLTQKGRAKTIEASEILDKIAHLLNPKNIAGVRSPQECFSRGGLDKENFTPEHAWSEAFSEVSSSQKVALSAPTAVDPYSSQLLSSTTENLPTDMTKVAQELMEKY